jgi:hypothetical protein
MAGPFGKNSGKQNPETDPKLKGTKCQEHSIKRWMKQFYSCNRSRSRA